MEPLLSCGEWNKSEGEPGSLRGKLPGVFPEQGVGKFPGKVLGRKDWLDTQA